MSDIYTEIQGNIEAWDKFVLAHIPAPARLISVSEFSNQRVYLADRRIFKIQRPSNEKHLKENSLVEEYEILYGLRKLHGICKNPQYTNKAQWEILSYDFAEGRSLESLLIDPTFNRKLSTLIKILTNIIQINLRGIAHRDIKPGNIIIGQHVHIIDFDQAKKVGVIAALFIDILGIGKPKNIGFFSYVTVLEKYFPNLFTRIASKSLKIICRPLIKQKNKFESHIDIIQNDPDLETLKQAWRIAQNAGANSPGKHMAYYSINIGGHIFPGERSWILRWSEISKKVDLRDKMILECGCNLGLLSAFANRSGAKKNVGVDWNNEILEGSKLVSKALHADCQFEQIDFDSQDPWEEKLEGFDLVTALSVAHWLKNQDRFIRFLGTHKEVIYEGHDSIEIETKRLKKVGFKNIEIISISERDRAILYARK